jgi:hypothetical protein
MRVLVCFLVVVVVVGCAERKKAPPTPEQAPPVVADTDTGEQECSPGAMFCVGDDVVECLADGSRGKTMQTCNGRCSGGKCVDTCAVKDVELIYVVDSDNILQSFDPRRLPGDPFRKVGTLACDRTATPFSMAIDRNGIAWVLYNSGKLYRVSIIDAHCSAVPAYTPSSKTPRTFGMGFVSDGPNSTTEKLYVAADDASHTLAHLDTTQRPPPWQSIGTIDVKQTRNPELTGTGDGKLYGYFPESGRGFIQELDRKTGAPTGARFDVVSRAGDVNAWAFAHWGGVFYVFATIGDNSTVTAVHIKTGKSELLRERLPSRIVGAGVSTCAPLLEAI